MIQIKINDKTEQAKAFISYMLTLPFVEYVPNSETLQALDDAQNNKTTTYNSTKELFIKLKAEADVQD